MLEETRQLKKITESVFDRSKDEVANTDFPEELYWQLELREYDIKITEVRNSVSKFNIALTSLARAANLTEAALMAFLGYPDAAYKVWRVEYALKASQKMRLCKFTFFQYSVCFEFFVVVVVQIHTWCFVNL